MRSAFRANQNGTSLVEVLITMSILAFGLLGIADIQASSMANMYSSYQYAQAASLTQSMLEKLRANRTATITGLYHHAKGSIPAAPGKDCSKTICSPAELSAWDLAVWYSMVADTSASPYAKIPLGPLAILPSGQTSIVCLGPCSEHSVHLVTVYWDARRNGAKGAGCNPQSSTDMSCFRLAYVP